MLVCEKRKTVLCLGKMCPSSDPKRAGQVEFSGGRRGNTMTWPSSAEIGRAIELFVISVVGDEIRLVNDAEYHQLSPDDDWKEYHFPEDFSGERPAKY